MKKSVITTFIFAAFLGAAPQAHALDLITMPFVFLANSDGKMPSFPITNAVLGDSLNNRQSSNFLNVLSFLLAPFAILDDATKTITVDEAYLVSSGYTHEEILAYGQDLTKIQTTLGKQTFKSRQAFQQYLDKLNLHPITQDLIEIQ